MNTFSRSRLWRALVAAPLFFAAAQSSAVVATTPKACYDVSAAIGGNKHAMWLPDDTAYGSEFIFKEAPGTFIEHGNNKATLSGLLTSSKHPTRQFNLTLEFEGYIAPGKATHTPKYEYNGGVCSQKTNMVKGFAYYETFTKAKLVGVAGSFYDGVELTMTRMGPPLQIGVCANGKNDKFGASTWFNFTVTKAPANHAVKKSSLNRGDFNLNLAPCAKLLVTLDTIGATSAADGVNVAWTTVTESVVIGYNVWRAVKDANGEYAEVTRLTNAPIAVKGSATTGATYSFVDTTAEAGVKYFYALESVDAENNSNFYLDNIVEGMK